MTAAETSPARAPQSAFNIIPREHGATAMLLIPFFSAAILIRRVAWMELIALLAIALGFAIKDPLIVIARQRFIWKQNHPETQAALRVFVLEAGALVICASALLTTRDWHAFSMVFVGAGAFTALAVFVNVRNRQRSEWFQVASAAALSSTSIVSCLSASGGIPAWAWILWILCTLQASSGVFVVHARLDARIAARKGQEITGGTRRAAQICLATLFLAAIVFAFRNQLWITVALLAAVGGYWIEMRRQMDPSSLQLPLKRVGQQALGLSIGYATIVIIGLWT